MAFQKDRPSSFITNRPVAILMVVLAAVVFGYFSYRRLPLTLMPELSYPTLTVRTEYPGAAPEEVENDVTRPIEESLGVIGGLRRISSVSRAGISDVVLEFNWGISMSEAVQDTLEKLDLVFLPDEAERPLILRFDPSLDPVLELSVFDAREVSDPETSLRRLRRIADLQIKRALEPIKGVAAVRLRGGLEEEIHVDLDQNELERASLSVQDVTSRLTQENINVAGGTLKDGRTEYMVRTLNEYENLSQIRDTVVTHQEGRQFRVRDLGRVTWSNKDRQIITHTDGRESVQLEIYKEADANIVALAQRIKETLGDFDPDRPDEPTKRPRMRFGGPPAGAPGMQGGKGLARDLYQNEEVLLKIVADRSVFIEDAVNEVLQTAMIGGLLAILILYLFLRNARTTAIIAVSIPVSLVVTFAPLNMFGISLNIMSLGGLALGIGMLVDSSIVVLESIFRCREEGDDITAAAIRGVKEVRMAVAASTLTTIAVFFPMVFVEGVAGQAFGDLGVAVVASLLAALVVALFFIPMLASRTRLQGDAAARTTRTLLPITIWALTVRDWTLLKRMPLWMRCPFFFYLILRLPIGAFFEITGRVLLWFLRFVKALILRILFPVTKWVIGILAFLPMKLTEFAMRRLQSSYPPTIQWALRHPWIMLFIAALCLAGTLQLGLSLDSELLPEVHQGEFSVEAALPVGTPLEETLAALKPVESAIMAHRQHIQSVLVTYGFDPTTSQRADEGEHTARIKIILENSQPRVEAAVIQQIRDHLRRVPDLESRVERPVLFSFRTPVEVEIHGQNLLELRRMAETVASVMEEVPALTDVETTQRRGAPEVQIQYDRDQLIRFGLNIEQVALLVRDAVKGNEATRFNLGDRRVPVVVRLQESDRRNVDDLKSFVVNPRAERPIPLSALANVVLAEGPSEVRRVDGRRVALVRANVGLGSLGSATAELRSRLQSRIQWPAHMTFTISGQDQEWRQSRQSLLLALALSVFLVYVIMAAQFESLLQPLIIMLTIPMAFLGTVILLSIMGLSLSVVVFLGMIMLAGIVVNNAIVLVDYINTLRQRGMACKEAIVQAGRVRLRPILMTTATTVLGLLPMALGRGDGAEIRTPMALTVMSGLLVSTFLTLLIIPSIYYLVERKRSFAQPDTQEEPV